MYGHMCVWHKNGMILFVLIKVINYYCVCKKSDIIT